MEAWKQFEADSAALFGGKRFWANSGERIDFEGPNVSGQCKLVKSLSLEALTKLVEEMEIEANKSDRLGVVCVKVRRGKGKPSPSLVVMSFEIFKQMLNPKIVEKGTV